MKLKPTLLIALFFISSLVAGAQTKPKPTPNGTAMLVASPIKASPAFAEVIARRTEVIADLESLLLDYTESYPKVRELKFESGALQKELDRLLAVPVADSGRLSAALGRLMVRKCALATELFVLQDVYNDEHADVKRAKKRLEIFESAINEILSAK